MDSVYHNLTLNQVMIIVALKEQGIDAESIANKMSRWYGRHIDIHTVNGTLGLYINAIAIAKNLIDIEETGKMMEGVLS